MEFKEPEMGAAKKLLLSEPLVKDHDGTIDKLIGYRETDQFWKWLLAEATAMGATRIDVSTIPDYEGDDDAKEFTCIDLHGVDRDRSARSEFEVVAAEKISQFSHLIPVSVSVSVLRL